MVNVQIIIRRSQHHLAWAEIGTQLFTEEYVSKKVKIWLYERPVYPLLLRPILIVLTVHLSIDPISHRGAIICSINIPNSNGDQSAPFDQKSYLLISLADGGSSSYFPEGLGNKPWSNFI